ncbi:MAG: helix-turn-helix transcriptional regulator [Synergistaceae bacterium]|nr:helix-turn-helix transcriptional regulator [Synergistaceae bacterium]
MDRIYANVMLQFRKESHLTQKSLAKKMGITQSAISKIEDGSNKPTLKTISKFCRTLGISANEFFLLMAIQLFVLVFTQEIWLDDDDDEGINEND